ncbi:MAG: methyl-accepting chemotaxis protein, partial [Alphaproteobacteria bacterium]|nr:methyl-accepting chemotaxis protein [Alphaproteobacteria bacterium]
MSIRNTLLGSFLAISFLSLISGITALYFLYDVSKAGFRAGAELAPLGDAAMEIKLTATHAHLLFEEIMAGDEGEDINEVWRLLDETKWYSNAILNGGENDEGKFYATDVPTVREKIESVLSQVESFIKAAETRYASYSGSQGVGSDADDKFDDQYEKVQADISQVLLGDVSKLNADGIRALGMAKYHMANGHLYLAEILGGDAEESFDAVVADFEAAKKYILQISASNFSSLSAAPKEIDSIITLAKNRFASLQTSESAGSAADEAFDQSFEAFILEADEAEEIIHDQIDAGISFLLAEETAAEIAVAILSSLTFIVSLIGALVISGRISRPISEISKVQNELASGNLDAWVPEIQSPPEIASLCKSMYKFKQETRAAEKYRNEQEEFKIQVEEQQRANTLELARNFEAEVGGVIEVMVRSAEELSGATTDVSQIANRTASRSTEVRESANNAQNELNEVTHSVNEVNSSISNVAKEMTETSNRTGQVVSLAEDAGLKVQNLNDASAKIKDIVTLIADIAEQTNL